MKDGSTHQLATAERGIAVTGNILENTYKIAVLTSHQASIRPTRSLDGLIHHCFCKSGGGFRGIACSLFEALDCPGDLWIGTRQAIERTAKMARNKLERQHRKPLGTRSNWEARQPSPMGAYLHARTSIVLDIPCQQNIKALITCWPFSLCHRAGRYKGQGGRKGLGAIVEVSTRRHRRSGN